MATVGLLLSPIVATGDEVDPLSLQSAPVSSSQARESGARVYLEGSVGWAQRRFGLGSESLRRLSLDYGQTFKLGRSWNFVLSDRLDHTSPVEAGSDATVNSLREVFVGWREPSGSSALDFGRINFRQGPAYGYNPTDFFRDGAIRSATSDDPFAQRETRLGTVMARFQQLSAGSSFSLAAAPKLATGASAEGLSADIGATNQRNRILATWSQKWSDRTSGQVMFFGDQVKGAQAGLNLTTLLSDALVGHLEWAYGRDDLALTVTPSRGERHRLAVGTSYTLPTSLAVTLEYQYNGFAPTAAEWNRIAATDPGRVLSYLADSQRRQESASRSAWLIYATQRNAAVKGLDLTGFIRINADDNSRLTWLEARYHWPQFDGALQWRMSHGKAGSEYGSSPRREVVQLLGAWFF